MSAAGKDLYPMLFYPVYKDYLWGGDKIVKRYRRDVPSGVYAESWEVSGHPDGISVVANGRREGTRLDLLVKEHGSSLLGSRVGDGPFPLLIKLIDSADRLSVQVHPNDETAERYGGEAKTEMWYFLDADAGAEVFAGLRPGIDERAFRRAMEDESFEQVLRRVPVSAGDAVFIPGGRVHAVDRGCLILEVQQSSNTTYRIHDWGRVDANGKPRELHVEEAVRVATFEDHEDAKVHPRLIDDSASLSRWEIYESRYFRMERWAVSDGVSAPAEPGSFQVLFCSAGRLRVEWDGGELELSDGTSCLIPACLLGYRLSTKASAELLHIIVP